MIKRSVLAWDGDIISACIRTGQHDERSSTWNITVSSSTAAQNGRFPALAVFFSKSFEILTYILGHGWNEMEEMIPPPPPPQFKASKIVTGRKQLTNYTFLSLALNDTSISIWNRRDLTVWQLISNSAAFLQHGASVRWIYPHVFGVFTQKPLTSHVFTKSKPN